MGEKEEGRKKKRSREEKEGEKEIIVYMKKKRGDERIKWERSKDGRGEEGIKEKVKFLYGGKV